MTKEEWRHATRASIGEQARAGIAVWLIRTYTSW
jgi:hypothetical protein